MGRDLYDVDRIYRVRFVRFYGATGEHEYFQGPYDARTTAQAIATRFNREVARQGKVRDSATVEYADTKWQQVTE